MDPALYNKIYGDGINKEIIPKYVGYLKPYYLYYLTEDHVRGVKSEVEN